MGRPVPEVSSGASAEAIANLIESGLQVKHALCQVGWGGHKQKRHVNYEASAEAVVDMIGSRGDERRDDGGAAQRH